MALDYLLVSGSFFCLVVAIGQLFVRGRSQANILFCLLSCSCSLWIAHAFYYRIGVIDQYAHLNKLYVPFLCMTGPLWFLHSKALVAKYDWRKSHLFHGVSTLICILLSIPFYLQDAAYKRSHFETNIYDVPGATIFLATRLAELSTFIYIGANLRYWTTLHNQVQPNAKYCKNATNVDRNARPMLSIIRLMQILIVVCLLAIGIRLLGSVFGTQFRSVYTVLIPSLLIVAVVITYFILSCRYPQLLDSTHLQIALLQNTAKQPCSDAELEELQRYGRQIRLARLYLDPNLKLLKVSRKLGIPMKQLSRVINSASDTNFNGFINEMRIEHAKNLLVENPSLTIVEVAQCSGFNSKSVFYDQFTRFGSCTPNAFRSRNCNVAEAQQLS